MANLYSPDLVLMSFFNRAITGYAAGSFIKAMRTDPIFKTVAGANGSVTRVRSGNKAGSVELTVLATDPINDFLMGVADADLRDGTGAGELLIKEANGTSVFHCQQAWISEIPSLEYSDAGDTRVWKFETGEISIFVGGTQS